MLHDDDLIAELGSVGWRRADPRFEKPYDYQIAIAATSPGSIELELRDREGDTARLRLALPSAGSPQYWLYAPPQDDQDWVSQFPVWLDEGMYRGGLGPSRVRVEECGLSYVVVENYGWRRSDPLDHSRLRRAAGPLGWYGGGTIG